MKEIVKRVSQKLNLPEEQVKIVYKDLIKAIIYHLKNIHKWRNSKLMLNQFGSFYLHKNSIDATLSRRHNKEYREYVTNLRNKFFDGQPINKKYPRYQSQNDKLKYTLERLRTMVKQLTRKNKNNVGRKKSISNS